MVRFICMEAVGQSGLKLIAEHCKNDETLFFICDR